MNKQEALEALLTKMRDWEQPYEEVKSATPGVVTDSLRRNYARLMDLREAEMYGGGVDDAEFQAALICLGAAALYLLVDEVEVVTSRPLKEWLAEPVSPRTPPVASRPQYPRVHRGTEPPNAPMYPTNGIIGGRRDG